MKPLLCVTTYPQAPYIYPECWNSILGMRWAGAHEMIVLLDKFEKNAQEKVQNSSEKYIRARELFLASDCDALLTLEADHVFPADTLEKLASVEADIVYGLYCSRPSRKHRWMLRRGERIGIGTAEYDAKFRRSVWNRVVPSDGLGTGCTLIRRRVLEALEIHWSPGLGHDWHLAKDAKAAGFTQMHDCRVHVGHILENRTVVWPDPDKTFRITGTGRGVTR